MAALELSIIIVGAGIAGLGAAIVLSRAGHNVTIVEKSQFKQESGFMIIVGWNATNVLSSFDFDFEKARGSDSTFIRTYNGATLESSPEFDLRNPGIPNSQCKTFYRPDLHNELKRHALYPGPGGKVPTLILGQRVTDVNIETATVTLANGTTLSGDLIIGADGERSIVKKAFNDPDTLKTAKYRIFRTLVPTESLMGEEGTRNMLEVTRGNFCMFLEGKRTMFWFEGRDGLLQDLEAGYVPDEDDGPLETDPEKARQKMLEKFGDYHPSIVDSLRKIERVQEWEVNFFSRPHPRLCKGKALIIGDAAHSMFPTTGQGGSASIEDIGALSLLFSTSTASPFPLTSRSQISERLKLFDKVRKDRIAVVMGMSGCIFGKEEEYVKNKPWLKGALGSGEGHVRYLYGYDVLKDTKRVLEEERRLVERVDVKARL